MRSYLIDEISPSEIKKTNEFLSKNAIKSNLEGIFWVKIPDDILDPTQYEHKDCRPHVFAIEMGRDWIKLEFFIRSLHNMRCSCPNFCTTQQRNHIINFAHNLIEIMGIPS
jgi:hypothetical protein